MITKRISQIISDRGISIAKIADITGISSQILYHCFNENHKRELKADCRQVEKYIQLIEKGKITEKNIAALEKSVVKLQTILTGLISFFSR